MKRLQNAVRFILTLGLTGFPLWAAAENPGPSSSASLNLKPIEVRDSTLFGLAYSMDDRLLLGQKDFEDLIFPLNDYEATRLLKVSESSGSTGQVFRVIGLAGFLTGVTGLLTTPSNQQTPFWITAIGGGATLDIAGLFQSESQSAKFNCVQRYNRFARGEEQVLPHGPQNEKSLLNFDHPSPSSKTKNKAVPGKKGKFSTGNAGT